MDFGLTIEETKDKSLILGVLTHPDIYSCIIDDSSPDAKDFDLDVNDGHYLVGYDSQKNVIGLMAFHKDNNWSCHIQVFPKYRKVFAKLFCIECLSWFFDKYKADLYAEIPEKYPNVAAFAKKVGFTYKQKLMDSCIIDNIAYNIGKYQLRYSQWAS